MKTKEKQIIKAVHLNFSFTPTDSKHSENEVMATFTYQKQTINYPIKIKKNDKSDKNYYIKKARERFVEDNTNGLVYSYIKQHYLKKHSRWKLPVGISAIALAVVAAIVIPICVINANRDSGLPGGDGTAEHPYIIKKAEHLESFSNLVNNPNTYNQYASCHFRLDDNLNLVKPLNPIGTMERPFKGVFDGNNKTISNLIINNEKANGMFNNLQGEVNNLILDKPVVLTTCDAGIITSITSQNNDNSPTTIKNVVINGGQIVSSPYLDQDNYCYGGEKVGGIVGHADTNTTISNCEVNGLNISAHHDLGAIIGNADKTCWIQSCKVNDETTLNYISSYAYHDNIPNQNMGKVVGNNISAQISDDTKSDAQLRLSDYVITNVNHLLGFFDIVNKNTSPNNHAAHIINDINMSGVVWPNISLEINKDNVLIDGHNHVIKSLNIVESGDNCSAFIDQVSYKNTPEKPFTIKNLGIEDSHIESRNDGDIGSLSAAFIGHAGRFAFENCHVKNCNIIGQHFIGGFVAYDADGSSTPEIKDCYIDNVHFTSNRLDSDHSVSVGGFCGYAATSHHLINFSATNLTFTKSEHEKAFYSGLYHGKMNTTLLWYTSCPQATKEQDKNVVVGNIVSPYTPANIKID